MSVVMQGPPVDYTALSVDEIRSGLDQLAHESQREFGHLDAGQLNWKPDATRWSVAQCFDHLLIANRQMVDAAVAAMRDGRRRTVWERLPMLPRITGRMLVRSQSPDGTRKFVAPKQSQPAASDVAADVVSRFVSQQQSAVDVLRRHDDTHAATVIMTSPFVGFVTYSVLDGWRLMLAHGRRHFEQARRVTQSPQFPRSA